MTNNRNELPPINYTPWIDEREHDDMMTADDYDARRYARDGWGESRYDRQRW